MGSLIYKFTYKGSVTYLRSSEKGLSHNLTLEIEGFRKDERKEKGYKCTEAVDNTGNIL